MHSQSLCSISDMTYASCSQLLPVRMPGNISDDLLNTVKDVRYHFVLTGREWFV